ATFARAAGHTVQARGPDDQVPAAEVADEEFTGCLGSAVGVDWVGRGALGVRFTTFAVEDIVRAQVNQTSPDSLGHHSQVPNRDAVDLESLIDVRLASLDLVKGGRIDD